MQKEIISDERFQSVVIVRTESGLGSGFYISSDEIITNYHVIEKSRNINVIDQNNNRSSAIVLKKDLKRDLALLKTNSNGKPVQFFSGAIKQGSKVDALGHPKGRKFSISQGIVSAIRKEGSVYNATGSDNVLFIQTDAAINKGNSGGPLFNLEGEVIGIHSSIGGSLAENRHVPSSVFKAGWDRMLAGEIWGSLGMMAAGVNPDRPMLGVRMNDSNGQVTVDKVFPNSPAKRAGIEDGDVILKIDGIAAEQMSDVVDQVSSSSAGDVLEVQIMRDDKEQSFKVKLVSWEDLASGLGNEEEPKLSQDTEKARPQLGVILDAEFAGRGAKIYEVINGSIASMAGILSGDIVKSVDGAEIFDANEMASKIKSAPLGSKIKFSIQRGNQDQLVEAEILFK